MARQYTLGRNERLKSRKLIEELFSTGQRMSIAPFRVFFSLQEASALPPGVSVGFGAGSRHFKTAVERNRIKRLMREAYRLQKNELRDKLKEQNRRLNVFFIYTGKELPLYEEVCKSMHIALTRLLNNVTRKP